MLFHRLPVEQKLKRIKTQQTYLYASQQRQEREEEKVRKPQGVKQTKAVERLAKNWMNPKYRSRTRQFSYICFFAVKVKRYDSFRVYTLSQLSERDCGCEHCQVWELERDAFISILSTDFIPTKVFFRCFLSSSMYCFTPWKNTSHRQTKLVQGLAEAIRFQYINFVRSLLIQTECGGLYTANRLIEQKMRKIRK